MISSISIIIPTYKRNELLRRALKSVFIQELPLGVKAEVIICNDDSTTDITQVVADLIVPEPFRLICINQEKNVGSCLNRNSGVERATGEIMYFLDDDDEWIPGRFTSTLHLFENPQTMIVTAGYYWCEEGHPPLLNLPPPGTVSLMSILSRNFLGTTFTACRSSAVKEAGGFDPVICPCEEFDLWIRVLKKYPNSCQAVSTPVSKSFFHPGPKLTKIEDKLWAGKKAMVDKFRPLLTAKEFSYLRTYMLAEIVLHTRSRRKQALAVLFEEPLNIRYSKLFLLFARAFIEKTRRSIFQTMYSSNQTQPLPKTA